MLGNKDTYVRDTQHVYVHCESSLYLEPAATLDAATSRAM